jgi:hypothetical protein
MSTEQFMVVEGVKFNRDKISSGARLTLENVMKDANYTPYCMTCKRLVRMERIAPLFFQCKVPGHDKCDYRGNRKITITRIDVDNNERVVARMDNGAEIGFTLESLLLEEQKKTPNNPTIEQTGLEQYSICIGIQKVVTFRVDELPVKA